MEDVLNKINSLANSIISLKKDVISLQEYQHRAPHAHDCSFKDVWVSHTNSAVKLNNPLKNVLSLFFDVDEDNNSTIKPEFDSVEGRQRILLVLVSRLVQSQNQLMMNISKHNRTLIEEDNDFQTKYSNLERDASEISRQFNKILVFTGMVSESLEPDIK